nr:immunoglobulin light chain junction region [Macaca mulatta]
TACALEFPWTF